MDFALLPPRHQLAELMSRLYHQGLTTSSGGNLSIRDGDAIWITPAAVDKGMLTPDDMMCVHADGSLSGRHRPSSEYPFHRMIYDARPDLKALVHAHPSALVSFSIVRKVPDTRINPQSRDICGEVGYAPYALPGSEALGEKIAGTFSQGHNVVLLENHGAVTGGETLLQAFQRLETLEFCAQINILAGRLGQYRVLDDAETALFFHRAHDLLVFTPQRRTSRELELRREISAFVRRAYTRKLMIGTGGTVSARIDDTAFLITPYGADRCYLSPEEVVLIAGGQREAGILPSRAVRLHEAIYQAHPHIGCIMSAQPPHATTYAIAERRFDTRTIPESYIVLRDLPILPYGWQYTEPARVAAMLSKDTPILLLQNDAVLATGATLLEAYDRVEVAEFSAQALLNTVGLGELVPIGDTDIDHLKQKFLG